MSRAPGSRAATAWATTSLGPLCPVCGCSALGVSDRDEPVVHGEHGRALGWKRTIRTWIHIDGSEHRTPVGPVFEAR